MSNMARLIDEHRPVVTRTADEVRGALAGEYRKLSLDVRTKDGEVLLAVLGSHDVVVHRGEEDAFFGVLRSGPFDIKITPDVCVVQQWPQEYCF
ncbi:hypothetical protein LCGC14_2727450 [marine sediment metagenome]|uniref:Uncharacterized protein n=1 Tax=marine sediment metagenome TaxID=412755 RepID=A0A0F8Z8F4_9ZZZZ